MAPRSARRRRRDAGYRCRWADGRNIRIDIRWGAIDAPSREQFAKELVELRPDLLLTQSTPATAALLQQTRTIPILFVQVVDPVGSGFVASYPRPGGNITGLTNIEPTMPGKWLELKGDGAARQEGRFSVQPGHRALCRLLPETLQGRRTIVRGGGDRRTF